MSIVVDERFDSRSASLSAEASSDARELKFVAMGSEDDIAVQAAVLANSPLMYAGLFRQAIDLEHIGYKLWDAEVKYSPRKPRESGPASFSFQFDISAGTQHVTQSRRTIGRYAPEGKTAPDFKGAIGVTNDSVEGVDIQVPTFNFSTSYVLPAEIVTFAYVRALYRMTAKVNASSFNEFAAGEVLFLGASGSRRGEEDWDVNFKFAASPNLEGVTMGSITDIKKRGWEYLWVRYQDSVDQNTLVKVPAFVYVEELFEEADFDAVLPT